MDRGLAQRDPAILPELHRRTVCSSVRTSPDRLQSWKRGWISDLRTRSILIRTACASWKCVLDCQAYESAKIWAHQLENSWEVVRLPPCKICIRQPGIIFFPLSSGRPCNSHFQPHDVDLRLSYLFLAFPMPGKSNPGLTQMLGSINKASSCQSATTCKVPCSTKDQNLTTHSPLCCFLSHLLFTTSAFTTMGRSPQSLSVTILLATSRHTAITDQQGIQSNGAMNSDLRSEML